MLGNIKDKRDGPNEKRFNRRVKGGSKGSLCKFTVEQSFRNRPVRIG